MLTQLDPRPDSRRTAVLDNAHVGDIRGALGTGDFYRVRWGVGRPQGRQEPADFVLTPFPKAQSEDVAVEVSRPA